MNKKLDEMTLEELWQLFPIILKEHNPAYKKWYKYEEEKLIENFGNEILRINHIGSSSVAGLISKDTVDILMEISKNSDIEHIREQLEQLGWIYMYSYDKLGFHMSFNKGYTENGFAEKVYHLHIKYIGNCDELYFRDYLIENPDIAENYGKLKLKLMKFYKNDRDGYTEAKSEFIIKCTNIAKKKFSGRY